jgi:hypothetical protein
MIMRATVLSATLSVLTFGCAASQYDSAEDIDEVIDNLIQAGFPASDIKVVDDVVYVGNDAAVSLQASREMLEVDDLLGKEQYRTTNRVDSSLRTICIDGTALANFSLKFEVALDFAIANYNALDLTFSMQQTFGNTTNCDAIITAQVSGGTGGSAGFPAGGLPFGTINIGSGLDSPNFGVDTVEHVIAHELGHCIGLRHSDFFNRSISCGIGGNEGDAGVGAIHIPGTPTGATVGGSLMNSCFRTVETGEFSGSDIVGLETIY